MGILNFIADKIAAKINEKGSPSGWAKLFEMANEAALFGDTVTQPYRQISNVYKAVKAISDNVPQAELAFYRYQDDERIYPEDLLRLLDNPNPLMSGTDFMQAIVGFFALFGEAFIIKQESIGQKAGNSRLPAELWTFNPTEFTEIKDSQQRLLGWRHLNTRYDLSDVIVLKDFNPYSNIRGLAPTDVIKKTIDIDWQSLIYNKAFFDNFTQLGTVWTTDETLTEEQVKRIIEWQEKRHQGASKAFKMAIAHRGLKPVQSGISPKDMDFIEQKRFSREEVLGIWRVPKAMFSMTEELNYATFTGQMKIFWLYTIEPILRKLEAAFNNGLIQPYNPNIYCRFDTSNVAAFVDDFKAKVETGRILFDLGFTGNEINEKLQLGFEPKPWRDSWWIPFTLSPAGAAVKEPQIQDGKQNALVAEKSQYRQLGSIDDKISEKFFRNHGYWESKMVGGLRRFFFEQRKRILETLFKAPSLEMLRKDSNPFRPIDWEAEDQELLRRTMPTILGAITSGADFGKELLRERVAEELVRQRVRILLQERAILIRRINGTIKGQIAAELAEAIGQGETVRQMADRIRDVYNMAHGRAVLIARTEMTGALNGGNFLYCELAGVEKKKWLTARDEFVRESHQRLEGEVVAMQESFGNGLMFPGAPGPPEEICNCRCSWMPVRE